MARYTITKYDTIIGMINELLDDKVKSRTFTIEKTDIKFQIKGCRSPTKYGKIHNN